jgi:TolB-like protein/DNA-binding winged helix-turn-helix (wHTH) protein/Tfp pilus assembly protein PilF
LPDDSCFLEDFLKAAMSPQSKVLYGFGPFRLDAAERRLTRDGQPISLAPKAFDLLVVLVEEAGHLFEKDELLKRLWPDTFVEEATLAKHVSTLRKALGDSPEGTEYIETVPKAGYRFVAEVQRIECADATAEPPAAYAAPATAEKEERARPLAGVQVFVAAYVGWQRLRPLHRRLVTSAIVLALASAGYLTWQRISSQAGATGRRITLAVLPFQYLGSDPEQEYLGDALTEETITQLSRLNPERLAVIARTSTSRYRRTEQDAAAIGRELGADYLLEGSVQREGNHVRFTVQLVETREQIHVWAATYERELAQLLPLQSEMSRAIAREIAVKLMPRPQAVAAAANPEAYEQYLKGRHFWKQRGAKGTPDPLPYFRRAIELDPAFARAYAGLAEALIQPGDQASREAGESAARKALALDESLPEAHVSLGVLLMGRFAWAEAERELLRALELDPNHANAHLWHSAFLLTQARTQQAVAAAQRASELDPLSPLAYHQLGVVHYFSRQYGQAVEQFRRALEFEPDNLWTLLRLVQAYDFLGNTPESERAASRVAQFSEVGKARIAFGLARRGETAHARAILARESKNLPPNMFTVDLAALHLALGDADVALRHLEGALPSRQFDLWYLKVDPRFDALRSNPRFQQLLGQMGLTP